MTDGKNIPARASVIDDAAIGNLVRSFYAKVRQDPDLGPIFEAAIGDEWDIILNA